MALGTSKPVCYYQFENNANDDSNAGNTMDGTLVAGGSFSTAEKVRGSYSFLNSDSGGTGCIHSCGAVGDMAFFWTGVWTISFWVKRSDTATQYALGTQTSSGVGKYGFALKITNSQLGFLIYPGTSGTWVYSDTGFGGETGDTSAWHHLVVTSDATTIRFYGDGSEHGSGNTSYTTWPGATDMQFKLMLGSMPYSSNTGPWGANYLGYMDEVSLWDATATADEVASLYNSGAGLDLSDGLGGGGGLPSGLKDVGGVSGDSVKMIGGVAAASIKNIMGIS
jgi:hypothetical protein